MTPKTDAVVTFVSADGLTAWSRYALFVYQRPHGFAFVEPNYLDPQNVRPADHIVDGAVHATETGFTCLPRSGDYWRICSRAAADEAGYNANLDAAIQALTARGTTMERERMRVKERLRESWDDW